MAKTLPIRNAISLIESILTLGEALTPAARTQRLDKVLGLLRESIGVPNLQPHIQHDPFNEACRCDVCNCRRPITQADIDDAQTQIKALRAREADVEARTCRHCGMVHLSHKTINADRGCNDQARCTLNIKNNAILAGLK